MFYAVALVFSQIATASSGAETGVRPEECAKAEGQGARNVWERVKNPELRRYCDLLAGGAAKLVGAGGAEAALAIADEADRVIPRRAAPLVLRGRALGRLRRFVDATAALLAAKERDPSALDEPSALAALAQALARSGHAVEAREAYRTLLPRASSLGVAERGAAYVEAGALFMELGPAGLDDALAILRRGRQESQDVAQHVSLLLLSLALDRSGQPGLAREILEDRSPAEVRLLMKDHAAMEAMGPAAWAEAPAMLALALEPSDPAAARDAWQTYLRARASDGARGPWSEHARAHLARLGARGAARR